MFSGTKVSSFLAAIISLLVASGCVMVDPEHANVRSGAISFDEHRFERALHLDETSVKEARGVTEEEYRETLERSLAGQDLIAASRDDAVYSVDAVLEYVGYHSGAADPLYSAEAVYEVRTIDRNELLDTFHTTAIYSASQRREAIGRRNELKAPISQSLYPGSNQHHAGAAGFDVDPIEDRRLAYPDPGTPIFTVSEKRRAIAAHGALRASIADFIEYLRTDLTIPVAD